MTYDEILKIKDIEEVLEIYYNSNNFKLSMDYIIKKYYSDDAFKLFEDLSFYWEDKGHFKVSQGKNQLYKILLDFYTDFIKEDIDIFKDVLKYDYISLGRVSSSPNMFDKIEIDDFKNRCHIFLKNEENVKKYTPKFENTPAKNIIKHVHFEPFNYSVLKLKENIHQKLDKEMNTILFVYDLDKKVFEKSNSYKVVI
jgi:hypothetical protein